VERGRLEWPDEALREPDGESIADPALLEPADLHLQVRRRDIAVGQPEPRPLFRFRLVGRANLRRA
jgi:hypothetical protein